MKILAFDVSNNTISVAISENNKILVSIQNFIPFSQAEALIPTIEQALARFQLDYQDIKLLAVTNGPGSFTGIRIGLACAKGLLLGNNIRATAVNNFEIYYYRAQEQIKLWDKIIVLLNAYRGQLYVKIFEKFTSDSNTPVLLSCQEAVQLLMGLNSKQKVICTGGGMALIHQDIKNIDNLTCLPRFPKIKALYICRYIYQTLQTRKFLPLEPLYIRPPDASCLVPLYAGVDQL